MKNTVSTLAALTTLIASSAQAGDGTKINLTPDTPAEQLVEWRGANSPNLIDSRIDKTRRVLRVITTTNAPVSLDGACPPEDLYPGWKPDLGKTATPTSTGYPAEVRKRDILRTGPNGTWTLDTTAPSRPNQTLQTTLTCYRDGNDNDVLDEGEDRHSLTAYIKSQGSDERSSGASSYFTFSGEGDESGDDSADSSKKEHRVNMEGAAVGFNPAEGGWGPGFEAKVGWDPIGSTRDQVKRFTLGALYRYVNIDGSKHFRDTDTHTAAARFGWNPVVYDEAMRVAIDIGVAAGVSVTQQEDLLKDGRKAPDATNPIGTFDGGLEFGGDNVRGKVGGFYTLSEHPVQEGGGVTGGIKIEF